MMQGEDTMAITPLGGGQEVGRSCILLQYRGRTLMLDCGSHPGREGTDSLPFFDSIDDPEDIDLVLITHFHIDHCAALPYFTEKTSFKGKILMTHATKAVMKLLLSDNIRLQTRARPLYTEQELQSCVDKIDVLDYHQSLVYKGIRITATAAGHVLGAAMFTIEIDGIRVLYTGDYSLEQDRHLIPGSVPPGPPPDVLIVESTFGVTTLPSRDERESRFTSVVDAIVSRGGSCLIPVFALGRAQELLLVLDEYWQAHPHLRSIPVYYASKLASKALRVYQTFINTMSDHIRSMMDVSNPFKFNCIQNMLSSDFDIIGPSVVMASPGFLQSGVSRQLFERWCDDEKNGVIIAGYTVEGTLAHDLLNSPKEITCLDNRIKQRKCAIEHITFSAHVDYPQNSSFIKSVVPDNIILVHGEKTGMKRLKEELEREIRRNWPSEHHPSVAMPENGVRVLLTFSRPQEAEIVGEAAVAVQHELNQAVDVPKVAELPESTLMVTENFVSRVVASSELQAFTTCRLGTISQRMVLPIPSGLGLTDLTDSSSNSKQSFLKILVPYLEEIFDDIVWQENRILVQGVIAISIRCNNLEIRGNEGSCLLVEWRTNPMTDLLADSAVGLLSQTLSAPGLLRLTSSPEWLQAKTGKSGVAGTSLVGSRHRHRVIEENSQEILKKIRATN